MIELERFADTPFGTFGELHIGKNTFYTVERPWNHNTPGISCIPSGIYTLEPHSSPKHPDTFALVGDGVTHYEGGKRFGILIHPANVADELEGCIAPGLALGMVEGQWAVIQSQAAFKLVISGIKLGKHDKIKISWRVPE